jgi:flagellar biosynthesis protein FlhF
MKSSVFTARTVKEALRKVRDALGADAVIIGETRRDGLVEITASVEYPAAQTAQPARRGDAIVEHVERLRALGFDAGFVDTVVANVAPAARWETVERQVSRMIGVAPRSTVLARGRVRLIGPPGSGKTTSVIRLAANHVLQFGAGHVAIISQDVSRLAGCEQLQLASELLRVPVFEASDERGLHTALAETAGKALVIIDTPGIVATHRLPDSIIDLAGFETFLVLPATFNGATLARLVDRTRELVPTGVLVSHVDAVESIGEVLSICRTAQLPVTWIGAGGELAHGLESASVELLVDYAMRSLAMETADGSTEAAAATAPEQGGSTRRGRDIAAA